MVTFHDGEEVVLEARRHWVVVLPIYVTVALLALAPLVLYGVLDALPVAFVTPGWGPALLGFAYSGYLLALWVGGYLVWLDHHLDVWILTNERLIDVEQKGIFRREISSLRLERIQDITAEVDGALATFLKFGDIKVQTAGDTTEFVITNISNPQGLVEAVNGELSRRGKMGRIEA
jgi:Bacterial PH domain